MNTDGGRHEFHEFSLTNQAYGKKMKQRERKIVFQICVHPC
jgi:hypothetical protein